MQVFQPFFSLFYSAGFLSDRLRLSGFDLQIPPKRIIKIRHHRLLQIHGKIDRLSHIRQQLKLLSLPPKEQLPITIRIL